jgi:hypothetical protein
LRFAPVSGPWMLIAIRPLHFEMTIDQQIVEIEVNEPARSL